MKHVDDEWATALLLDPTRTRIEIEWPELEWRNVAFSRTIEGIGFIDLLVYDEYMDCVCATSKSVVVKPGWHPFFDHFAGSWEVEEENSILLETNEIELSLALSKEYLVGALFRYKTPQLKSYWGR